MAVIAVLAALCACGPSGAGPVPAAAGTETIVLRRADQPQAHRSTLERLKREAAASGRPLEEVVKRYAARVAATSSPRPTDFEGYDPAATDPDVVIDGIPYAELVDLGAVARAEGISYEEAIDRFGSQSSNSRVIDELNAEFPDEISGIRYVDDQRGLRIGFKGPIPARALELARTLPMEVTLVGRKGFSAAELREAQDTVVSWLRSRPEVATMMAHSDEETGQVKVTVQPKVMPDDAAEFTRGLQLPDLGNPRISVEVTLSAEPVAVRQQ
ncbi:unnamed protein product [[Actinomadura] parvosata subsp. kistnae]|uniref:Uncharacterized protein n=1 Tax=[Actinomadura] parvosata subsp. kistnae TaxID=1909395 RepID=A0A1U9ZXB3_9ACTN|nr:hypothetical protein [Nonomuraea sp. ATCC 55076]AQZ62584.1 hypothetical protein BKM31_14955 [Nonomuraea sp. ATCC 55076]SPL88864.1 unnamed protein product [Actinomadura parvosata subsp. kistnae]